MNDLSIEEMDKIQELANNLAYKLSPLNCVPENECHNDCMEAYNETVIVPIKQTILTALQPHLEENARLREALKDVVKFIDLNTNYQFKYAHDCECAYCKATRASMP